MTRGLPDFVQPIDPNPDRLAKLKASVVTLRDLEMQKRDAEENLTRISSHIIRFTREDLPELFNSAGVNSIGIDAEGNLPPYEAKLDTEFRSGIAKDWPPDQREKAFDYLRANDAEDLIKVTITISLPAGSVKEARKLYNELKKKRINRTKKRGSGEPLDLEMNMAVHHMTLTAWLRERFDNEDVPEKIDTIGGYIGPVVRLKPINRK
jgi:hypothetical protein